MNARDHTLNGKTVQEVFQNARVAELATLACGGNQAEIEAMRDQVNPNAAGLEGITPLLWAQDCGDLAGVEALLRIGADPNQSTGGQGGFTPVSIAAGLDDSAFLALLLRYNGDPNATYEGGATTALQRAFERGMDGRGWENYYALLEAGADINRANGFETIADYAAALNQYDKVAELLERGYTHNLPNLGLYVQGIEPSVMAPEQVEAAARVRTMLTERGVRFPVTPADAGLRPPASSPTNR